MAMLVLFCLFVYVKDTRQMKYKLVLALKILVVSLGLVFLFWSFQSSNLKINLLSDYWQHNPEHFSLAVFILVLLSVLNWFGEIKKWYHLVGDIPFYNAVQQTLISHSLSIFTPNKWGEYGGKCLFYSKKSSTKIILFTGLGHFCQLMPTLVFGALGLWICAIQFEILDVLKFQWSWMMLLPFLIVVFGFYFKAIRQKAKSIFEILKQTKSSKIKTTLKWSAFRYLVFAHQFLFLLWIFGAEISYIDGLGLIFMVYLSSSFIPVFAIADVVVKGSMAITLTSLAGLSTPPVIMTVFVMWLGNTILPALIGYFWMWSWQPAFIKSKL